MNLFTAFVIASGYGLEAPEELKSFTWPRIVEIVGSAGSAGCGSGRMGDHLVPDTIWGLNIKPACFCHDLACALARDKEEMLNAH